MAFAPHMIACQQREFASTDALFEHVGSQLIAEGIVRDTYVDALIAREREYPTGLPIPGGVAIPHTSPEHVIHNALVLVRPDPPLGFHEMGGGEKDTVDASLILFLVLSSADDHLATLQALMKALQDGSIRSELLAAQSAEQAARALSSVASSPGH